MILADSEIKKALEQEQIVIHPFRPKCLGTNSYDVHLGGTLGIYKNRALDAREDNPVDYFEIPDEGYVLSPGQLYLGVTEEYTETRGYVPFLEGKSSTGRLGISVHATAGKGDEGFANHWTLELSVVQPVKVYKGMPIAQLIYFKVYGDIDVTYSAKPSAKYATTSDTPQPSAMWRNFPLEWAHEKNLSQH